MHKFSEMLPILLFAFLGGVLTASFVTSDVFIAATFLCIAFAMLLLTPVVPIRSGSMVVLLFVALALGVFRYESWEEQSPHPLLASLVGKEASFVGIVDDEPDVREAGVRLSVRITEAVINGATTTLSGRALLLTGRYPEYAYGDRLAFRGVLELPRAFADDRGRVFNYPMYLKAKGIDYQFYDPSLTLLARGEGNVLREGLLSFKHAFLENIARVLPEPESALAGGILLGGKRTLGEAWNERFRVVGLVHILVLSGYNMMIVAEWLGRSALIFGFYAGTLIAALGVVLFALAAGAGATVVRAAIMALLVLFARLTGRTNDAFRALLFAGALMVAHNPGILAYDPSFQLSFLASLGLIFFAPLIELRTAFIAGFPKLRDALVATLATQIVVLPLLLYQTGLFSVIALLANLLVLPLVPLTMFFSFFAGLTGFLGNAFAVAGALPAEILLSYILLVGKWGSELPFAAITLPPIPGWIIFVLYGGMMIALYWVYHPRKEEARKLKGK